MKPIPIAIALSTSFHCPPSSPLPNPQPVQTSSLSMRTTSGMAIWAATAQVHTSLNEYWNQQQRGLPVRSRLSWGEAAIVGSFGLGRLADFLSSPWAG